MRSLRSSRGQGSLLRRLSAHKSVEDGLTSHPMPRSRSPHLRPAAQLPGPHFLRWLSLASRYIRPERLGALQCAALLEGARWGQHKKPQCARLETGPFLLPSGPLPSAAFGGRATGLGRSGGAGRFLAGQVAPPASSSCCGL